MTREEEIKETARIRANQYSHPVEWNDCYKHWIEGAEWADAWWINKLESVDISLRSRLHNIWKGMHQRCNNPNKQEYKYYGAKGIKVCREWSNYMTFLVWAIFNGYEDNLTIDRIDSNKDYTPDNCRWVDYTIQANNTARNHIIDNKTIGQLAKEANINYRTIHNRITRSGMGAKEAKESLPYNPKKVFQFDMEGNFITEFSSARIACEALGGKHGARNHIDDVCRGTRKSAFGYKWKYNK